MITLLFWTGAIFWLAVAGAGLWVMLTIIGNIYGGIAGSYRLERIIREDYADCKRLTAWQHFKRGARAWTGQRYDGARRTGVYYQVGGREIPVDGRDPLPEYRFYGAGDD